MTPGLHTRRELDPALDRLLSDMERAEHEDGFPSAEGFVYGVLGPALVVLTVLVILARYA